MKKKVWKGLVALTLVSLVCASAALSSGTAKIKVALLEPCAINDGTWCQAGYDAATKLKQQGLIDLKVISNTPQDTASIGQLMAQYAQAGNQLVIAHSSWQDAAFSVASKYPNTNFVYGGGGKTGGNVATYAESVYLASYLGGILAGSITKTGVIGGVAALDIPLCHAELKAFLAGAKVTHPGVKQLETYIGTWSDVAKAKTAVLAQADQKADVFTVCGDGPARGMIQAIKERNLSGFGYVGNENALAPKNMVGSFVYNLYPIFKKIVADASAGKFKGTTYDVGLQSFNLTLNPSYSVAKIPASAIQKMKQAQAAILSGKMKVPYAAGG
jgi:basic membrane protein A and related proteins